MRTDVVVVVIGLVAASCGGGERNAFEGASPSPADGGPDAPSTGGDAGTFGDGGPTTAGGADCTEENKQIYVVTEERELHRFAPATGTLTKIGKVACASGSATPFPMAVDRSGIAWVLTNDGKLWKVDTNDASCTATTFKPGQKGFSTFGMAFVADEPGGTNETLFVADTGADGLGKIDTKTLELTFVGSYEGFAAAGELTGTGSGRLFAFFTKKPPIDYPRVVELDRATGKIKDQKGLFGTEIGSGWAFAHWGGDFWLFTAPSGSSMITKFDYAASSTDTVKKNLPFVIVGAGVSTCAPTTRPR